MDPEPIKSRRERNSSSMEDISSTLSTNQRSIAAPSEESRFRGHTLTTSIDQVPAAHALVSHGHGSTSLQITPPTAITDRTVTLQPAVIRAEEIQIESRSIIYRIRTICCSVTLTIIKFPKTLIVGTINFTITVLTRVISIPIYLLKTLIFAAAQHLNLLGWQIELNPVPLANAVRSWSQGYINFIQNVIMNKNSGTRLGSLNIRDTFIADYSIHNDLTANLTLEQAEEFGFIISQNQRARFQENPNIRVRPLLFWCHGVTSGNTLSQIREATRVIIGADPRTLPEANDLVLQTIERVRTQHEDANHIVIPFMVGHSLGGMFANAIAARNHFGSMSFNGLGLGVTDREFVGWDNIRLANTTHSRQHIALSVAGDFVTTNWMLIEALVVTPGLRVLMNNGSTINPLGIHCDYPRILSNEMTRLTQLGVLQSSTSSSSTSANATLTTPSAAMPTLALSI